MTKTYSFLTLVFLLFSCDPFIPSRQQAPIQIDFSHTEQRLNTYINSDTTNAIHLAIAAMTSPKETFHYYEELIHYISKKMNRPVKIEQFKTYKEVNSHLEDKQIAAAFICSGAYIEAKNRFPIELLAIPVIQGKKFYNAYIITHRDSNIRKFEDLRGKSFAFTDPLSNSGRLYAIKRVKDLNSSPEIYFSKIIYTHGHDYSIQAVARKIVDGATVDGLIFNYLKVKHPEKVKNLRVIEVSEDFGMPPVVVHSNIDPVVKKEMRQILLNMHNDSTGIEILQQLMIDKFIPGNDTDYLSIQQNFDLLN